MISYKLYDFKIERRRKLIDLFLEDALFCSIVFNMLADGLHNADRAHKMRKL